MKSEIYRPVLSPLNLTPPPEVAEAMGIVHQDNPLSIDVPTNTENRSLVANALSEAGYFPHTETRFFRAGHVLTIDNLVVLYTHLQTDSSIPYSEMANLAEPNHYLARHPELNIGDDRTLARGLHILGSEPIKSKGVWGKRDSRITAHMAIVEYLVPHLQRGIHQDMLWTQTTIPVPLPEGKYGNKFESLCEAIEQLGISLETTAQHRDVDRFTVLKTLLENAGYKETNSYNHEFTSFRRQNVSRVIYPRNEEETVI